MKTIGKIILTIILIILMYKGIVYLSLQNVYTLLISIPFAGLITVCVLEKMLKNEIKLFGKFLFDDKYE